MKKYDDFELEEMRREEKADSIINYLEKQKRIKKETSRLKKLYKDIEAYDREDLISETDT